MSLLIERKMENKNNKEEKTAAFIEEYKQLIRKHGLEIRYGVYGHHYYLHDLTDDVLLNDKAGDGRLEQHLKELGRELYKEN